MPAHWEPAASFAEGALPGASGGFSASTASTGAEGVAAEVLGAVDGADAGSSLLHPKTRRPRQATHARELELDRVLLTSTPIRE